MSCRHAAFAVVAVLTTVVVVLIALIVSAYAGEYGGSFGELAAPGAGVGLVFGLVLLACAQGAALPRHARLIALPAGVLLGIALIGGGAALGGASRADPGVPGDSWPRVPTGPGQAVSAESTAHPNAQTVRPTTTLARR